MKKAFLVFCFLMITVLPGFAGDNWVPFPMGSEIPFPWKEVHGVWKAEKDDFAAYFAFKVVREKSTGAQQLSVKQIDAYTCETIGTGIGFENDKVIRAQLQSYTDGSVYRIALRAFDKKDAGKTRQVVYNDKVFYLSITPLDSGINQTMHVPLTKVSEKLSFKCVVEK